jgi:hypothetical protein
MSFYYNMASRRQRPHRERFPRALISLRRLSSRESRFIEIAARISSRSAQEHVLRLAKMQPTRLVFEVSSLNYTIMHEPVGRNRNGTCFILPQDELNHAALRVR